MMLNGVKIDTKNIKAARDHFIAIAEECKTLKVNDPEGWVKMQNDHIRELEAGELDRSLMVMQYAYYLQTGESIPILPPATPPQT
jgi:hypothetical protein